MADPLHRSAEQATKQKEHHDLRDEECFGQAIWAPCVRQTRRPAIFTPRLRRVAIARLPLSPT
jgi:hypothetical protein